MKSETEGISEAVAIRLQPPEPAQYFFSDGIEGYFEGHAFSTARGAGYVLEGRAFLRDFVTRREGRLLTHAGAVEAVLLPYAIRHLYAGGTSAEFRLLWRRRGVAVRVASEHGRLLGIAPLLDVRGDVGVEKAGEAFVVRDGTNPAMAVTSDQRFRLAGLAEINGLRAVWFETEVPGREFTLYAAFDREVESAVRKALALREEKAADAHRREIARLLATSRLEVDDGRYTAAAAWAKLSSLFMVTEQFGKGIWAGLPWFKDNWGRDTFIALPGTLLVGGHFEEAREVIRQFAGRQDTDRRSPTYGRIPNRVTGETDVIYNTADGTPWMIREIAEYLNYSGDLAFAREIFDFVERAIDGALSRFADDEGFITHDDADTWMDARIEGNLPWSARGNRANDIQALWHAALLAGAQLAGLNGRPSLARRWRELAARLKAVFRRRFWDSRRGLMADRLRRDGSRDLKPRPNQLMLLSIPFDDGLLSPALERRVLKNAFEELCFPHGICSLSPRHPYFHPYHHRDELWHFDSAYHNGTIWNWNAGFTITALCRHEQIDTAWRLARGLTDQILDIGCRGGLSELLDALPDDQGRITPSGTWQQAWSTSEFARTAYQDFAGFRPRLLEGRLILRPRAPSAWRSWTAEFPCGAGYRLFVHGLRTRDRETFLIRLEGDGEPLTLDIDLAAFGRMYREQTRLAPGDSLALVFARDGATAGLNGRRTEPLRGRPWREPAPLSFAPVPRHRDFPVLKETHFLRKIIEAGLFE